MAVRLTTSAAAKLGLAPRGKRHSVERTVPARAEEVEGDWIVSDTWLKFQLPYPPSVNHYWRNVDGKTIISRAGREYRTHVTAILTALGVKPVAGELRVEIEAHPPDKRRRDVDNILKAVLDACKHGGAYQDDSQVKKLLVEMMPDSKPGYLVVRVFRRDVP